MVSVWGPFQTLHFLPEVIPGHSSELLHLDRFLISQRGNGNHWINEDHSAISLRVVWSKTVNSFSWLLSLKRMQWVYSKSGFQCILISFYTQIWSETVSLMLFEYIIPLARNPLNIFEHAAGWTTSLISFLRAEARLQLPEFRPKIENAWDWTSFEMSALELVFRGLVERVLYL